MGLKTLFCKHNWEVVHNKVVDVYADPTDKAPEYYEFVLIQRCTKCGKVRKSIIKY